MKRLNLLLAGAGIALGAALMAAPLPVHAETPPNMLVIGNRIDDIISLDPAEAFEFSGIDADRNLYAKLVNFFPGELDKGYQPDLAASWEVAEDGLSITFTMKDGIKFSSGNPVTAEDAAFSLQRAVKLNKTPSFILTQFGFTPENVEEKIVADGSTLTLTLDKPYAPSFVLNCLGANIAGIVDKKTVLEHEVDGDLGNGWLKVNSAGAGPYTLVSWKPNESVTFTANENYYGGVPAMQRVIVRHMAESATQRLSLERGDIDIARNLNPEDIAAVEGNGDIKVSGEFKGQIMYASLNQKNEKLANPKVIEAFKYLADYEGMANSFLKGQWAIRQSFLPVDYLGAIDDQPYTYDLEKAKALLEEAGVGEFTIEAGVREVQERIEIAQTLQNALAQVGITLNITVATGAQNLDRYRARQLDVYIGTWGPDYPDPNTNASTFAWNTDNSDEGKLTGVLAWRNAWDPGGLTAETDAAVLEQDTDKRRATYEEIQREFMKTSPFVMMFEQVEQVAMRTNVEGLSLGGPTTDIAYWKVTK